MKPWLVLIIAFTLHSPAFALSMNGFNLDNSLVPAHQILQGGPPRDGIPSLDNPRFEEAGQTSWLQDDDLVLGVTINNQSKAYPVRILVWHEIVNDTLDSTPIVVTYCPLCGSGIAFSRQQGSQVLDFGVSGLLHNSDLLMYDRQSESLWSQIPGKAINGPRAGEVLTRLSLTHTSWKLWREEHPDSLVLSIKTGHQRDYDNQPYSGYEQAYTLYFPVENRDRRFHPKELTIGLAEGGYAKAWPFAELQKSAGKIEDTFSGKPITIHYDDRTQTAKIYNAEDNQLPATTLFWFAWYTFYPQTDIYMHPEQAPSTTRNQQ